jgi:hypothetical protein
MTTIQRLPLLMLQGSALALPAGFPGTGQDRPGEATPRGLWRCRAAGPASLGLAASMTRRRDRAP